MAYYWAASKESELQDGKLAEAMSPGAEEPIRAFGYSHGIDVSKYITLSIYSRVPEVPDKL